MLVLCLPKDKLEGDDIKKVYESLWLFKHEDLDVNILQQSLQEIVLFKDEMDAYQL